MKTDYKFLYERAEKDAADLATELEREKKTSARLRAALKGTAEALTSLTDEVCDDGKYHGEMEEQDE